MTRLRRLRLVAAAFSGVLSVLIASPLPAGETPPPALPEIHSFLDEVRRGLHTDEVLLDQYTFTEKHTQRRFDRSGNVKDVQLELYEVYPSAVPGHTYRKLVSRNGTRLSAQEIAIQDQKQQAKISRDTADPAGAARRKATGEENFRRREQEIIDQLFRVYDISIAGREVVDGRSTIVVSFRPRPGVRTDSRAGKILQKFEGKAWVDEADRQLVRAEGKLIEDFSYGLGVVARLYRGATASFQRRKVNGEVWLPAEARFTGAARVLLFKGIALDSLSEYSDYKKFSVATDSQVVSEKAPP